MKLLIVHNHYQLSGGEDVVVAAEQSLLRDRGHEVILYRRNNEEFKEGGLRSSLAVGLQTTWAFRSYREICRLLETHRPELAHFHNTFPLVSPSAYYACAEAGVPVVQTLHNNRLICPAATFLREGRVCEACLGKSIPWPGVVHACYRGSRSATVATVTMLCVHRALNTWRNKVQVYIALSDFARNKFIEGGLPAERIVVKSNFTSRPPLTRNRYGDFALYVGRLSPEKGCKLLSLAWQSLQTKIRLQIAGDGPLLDFLKKQKAIADQEHVELLGLCSAEKVNELMCDAKFLVVPSILYEGFPMVVVEAFSCGLPVIASRLGSLAEIVQDGRTGLLFTPGDPQDLAAKVEWAYAHPDKMEEMGRAARREYESKYTAEVNYRILLRIYQQALAARG